MTCERKRTLKIEYTYSDILCLIVPLLSNLKLVISWLLIFFTPKKRCQFSYVFFVCVVFMS